MTEQPQAEAKKKRGRETAGDMVRSLGLVMVVVVAVWFFAQPPDSDEARVRAVDPTADVSAFRADVPQAATPRATPRDWVVTVSRVGAEPRSLRVGYNTPDERYAEYAATLLPAADAVEELVGAATRLEPVDVGGATWQQYRDSDGSLSLVRQFGATTVVVGTLRATATLDQLRVLAGTLAV